MTISRRTFLAASAGIAGFDLTRRDLSAREIQTQRAPAEKPPGGFAPWLEIDAAALAHNVSTVRGLSGGRPVIAVTKNNAYGLGLSVAGPLLDRLPDVRALAVVRPDEAFHLRRAGVRKQILLMGPASESELVELVRMDVVQSPHHHDAPALLTRVARKAGRPVRVHAYVDTGMHRMGMPAAQALAWIAQLSRAEGVRVEGAFTELTEDIDFDRRQAAQLREMQSTLRAEGIAIATLHAASSDAVMNGNTDAFLDAVRPGLAIYGGYVSADVMRRGELRPAYRLRTRVMRVDRLAAGDGVSYHRRWVADRPTWTATLAIGHVDGYPSGAVKGCRVLARGRLYPVIGTVSASHTIISLGDEQGLETGDEVTLVGPDDPALHPNEVAKRAGWSEYNMFMHLAQDLKRIVV